MVTASFIVTYLLIVLGGWVRISGSGLGCGDHWPLCNGRLIPSLEDPATVIEWGHRLVAALVSSLVGVLAVWAFLERRSQEWRRRYLISVWVAALLAVQVILGAITVWLELPPWSVVLHLGTAMALLVLLLLAAMGGADAGSNTSFRGADAAPARMALVLAALSAVAVLLGALVANLDAAPACQGFPLCNGSILPGGHWRIHLHWTHRVVAYLVVLGSMALPFVSGGRARGTALLSAGLAAAQLLVAAVMVLRILPSEWRAAHVALGAAVFAALVAHTYRLGRSD
ncbi:MAG: heme A synthase [Gemmatimonadota bacterium]